MRARLSHPLSHFHDPLDCHRGGHDLRPFRHNMQCRLCVLVAAYLKTDPIDAPHRSPCPVTDFFGDVINVDPTAQSSCREAQALIAFAWLNFIIRKFPNSPNTHSSHHHHLPLRLKTVLVWLIMLIVFTITAHMRGQTDIWLYPVNGTDFYAQRAMREKVEYAGTPQQQYDVPVQQQQYAGAPVQQSYPPTGYTTSPSPGALQV